MRFATALTVAVFALLANSASAQRDAGIGDEELPAPPPPPECDVPLPPAPAPPAGDVPNFRGNVFFTSPLFSSATPVPRNVEVRLGGAVGEVARGFFEVTDGDGVVLAVDGTGVVVPPDGTGLWPANTALTVTLSPTPTNQCPGCFGVQSLSFQTNDVVDVDAPDFGEGLVVNGFVFPSLFEQQQCGNFNGATHSIELTVPATEPVELTVGARSARNGPTVLVRNGQLNATTALSLSFGPTVSFALREAVVLIVTARDLAGNVSAPVAVRLRMRSFRDRATVTPLEPLTCSLDPRPDVVVPSRLPRNPSLRVLFPFEEVPLALRPVDGQNGGQDVPLVPVTDVVDEGLGGHVYGVAVPVDAGAYDLVGLACPQCTCSGCNLPPRQRVVLDDVIDAEAPGAPVVRGVIDDPAPAVAGGGTCAPDDAATFVVLDGATDDVAGPADLLYDVVVKTEDGPPRPAGSALPALRRNNGEVVVRVPTAEFGRLAGSDFELQLTARDVAGNTSRSSYRSVEEEAGAGCGGGSGGGAAAALVGLVVWRRRRR